jgi:hypothetical protein
MQQVAMLFGPIVEARDVVESYLRDGVLVTNWRQRLIEASGRFTELNRGGDDDARLATLGAQIAELADAGLEANPSTYAIAAEIEHLLNELRVPGIPRPEDEDWAF